MVKLVTELYKSTLSVVCDFHFLKTFFCFVFLLFFFNPSCLDCFDNTEVSRKMSQLIHVKLLVAVLNPLRFYTLR